MTRTHKGDLASHCKFLSEIDWTDVDLQLVRDALTQASVALRATQAPATDRTLRELNEHRVAMGAEPHEAPRAMDKREAVIRAAWDVAEAELSYTGRTIEILREKLSDLGRE